MQLLFALFLVMPQDYVNLLVEGRYDEAIEYCDQMIANTTGGKSFEWRLEKGDIYLAKLFVSEKALGCYQELIDNYPPASGFWIFSKRYSYPDLGWLYLRLAQSFELSEDYLNAAKAYETVATKFRRAPLDSFALSGVERCFKKNYQDYVATIDGYNITRLELDEAMTRTHGKDEKDVLDNLILGRLIYANAVKYKIDETDFFKDNIKQRMQSLLLEEVHNCDVIGKAVPNDLELKRYYNKNRNNYKLREFIRGKEIVVESDSLAQYLLAILHQDIASFDSLAKLYSVANSRNLGGNMGTIYRGAKPAPVDSVIFKTRVNELTRIIPFDKQFGIYLITEFRPEQYRPFDEVKNSVEASVRDEKIKKIEDKFNKSLHDNARITIYKDSLSVRADSAGNTLDHLIATVNGRLIMWRDLETKNASQPVFGRVDLNNPADCEKLLDILIKENLQREWAERNKYYLNDGYFSRIKDELINTMDRGLYYKIVIEGVKADSAEVFNYYKAHKSEYKIPESYKFQEIVVDSKSQAMELRNQIIKNPELFDTLAQTYSTAATKARHGDTGYLHKGMRSKNFEDVAYKLKVGEISRVFSADGKGYSFVKLVEHRPLSYQTYEEVKPQIEGKIIRDKQRKVVDDFLGKIREEANIEILLDQTKPEELPEGETK